MAGRRQIAAIGAVVAIGAAGAGLALAQSDTVAPPSTSATPSTPATSSTPAAQTPLLGAPDPTGPTSRGVFLRDPEGQVEAIAATGHLVAWTVRTPADRVGAAADRRPATMPTSTRIVIADERGGAPLVLERPGKLVRSIRMLRGARGPAEPQLAVLACTSLKARSCDDELLTLTPAQPLAVTATNTGKRAALAGIGNVDSGRRLLVPDPERPNRALKCSAPIRVQTLATGKTRRLPNLPQRDGMYEQCVGITTGFLVGRYAFVSVERDAPKEGFSASVIYGVDVLARGKARRWRDVAHPYRYSDGSTGYSIGPAVTGNALYWEEMDDETRSSYSLERVPLPTAVERDLTARDENHSDPVAPGAPNPCDLAATVDAIYELGNPRCSAVDADDAAPSEIRRLVRPLFTTDE